MNKPLGLIGVPSELGANRKGTAQAPKVIFAKVAPKLKNAIVLGMIPVPSPQKKTNPKAKHLKEIAKLCQSFHTGKISPHIFPVVIGGDHSITYCVVKEIITHNKCGLVYCDAHGDYNTPKTTPSGNVHGMVISEIVGKANREFLRQSRPLIPERNIVLIGTRELDPEESVMLKRSRIKVFSPKDVAQQGPKKIMKQAISRAIKGRRGFHLSIDIDVVDARYVQGTSTPSNGGITPSELKSLVKEAAQHNITSMDIMEYNPLYDKGARTLRIIRELLSILDKA